MFSKIWNIFIQIFRQIFQIRLKTLFQKLFLRFQTFDFKLFWNGSDCYKLDIGYFILQSLFDQRHNILFKQTETELLRTHHQSIDDCVALQLVDVVCFPRVVQPRQNLANNPIRPENLAKDLDPLDSLGAHTLCTIKQAFQQYILLILECCVIRLLTNSNW